MRHTFTFVAVLSLLLLLLVVTTGVAVVVVVAAVVPPDGILLPLLPIMRVFGFESAVLTTDWLAFLPCSFEANEASWFPKSGLEHKRNGREIYVHDDEEVLIAKN